MGKVASILTCLKGRENYISRYLHISNAFFYKHKILVFKEKNTINFKIPSGMDVSVIDTDRKIDGMSDIFKVLKNHKQIILDYKYCHFVEDDNFIFARSLNKFVSFLESNKDYSAVVGKAFLHSTRDFSFLNYYELPKIDALTAKERLKEFKGGLTYYSLFRSERFSDICDVVGNVSDDNMSELAFNINAVAQTRVKFLNELFLAREYPRPRIYNIPSSFEWLTDPKFSFELKNLIEVSAQESRLGLSSQDFFNLTLLKYFSSRFSVNKKTSHNILRRNFRNITLRNSHQVKDYLKALKTFHI